MDNNFILNYNQVQELLKNTLALIENTYVIYTIIIIYQKEHFYFVRIIRTIWLWKFIPPERKIFISDYMDFWDIKKKRIMKINSRNLYWVGLFFKFWAIEFLWLKMPVWQTIRQARLFFNNKYHIILKRMILKSCFEFECNVMYIHLY